MASLELSGVRAVNPIRRFWQSDFIRHGALVFGATMATNVLNYAFNFAISRKVGVENFAVLSSLVSAIMLLSIPASVLNLIVVKYSAEFHANGEQAKLWRLSSYTLNFAFSVAAGLLLVGFALRGAAAAFLKIPNDATITLALAIMAITFVAPSARGILQGEQDFAGLAVSVALEAVLKVSLGVSLVYAGFGVFGAMSGWTAGSALALAVTILLVRRRRVEVRERLHLHLRTLAKTTIGIAVSTGALTVLSFIDVLLVKHYFTAYDAGMYAAVNLTGKIVLFLVSFLPMILLPKAIAALRAGRSPAPLLVKAALTTAVMCGGVLLIFGVRPELVLRAVAGNAFTGSAFLVLPYDSAMALLAMIALVVNYKIALHRFQFLYALIAAVVLEVGAITLWHDSLLTVVRILLVGNALALLGCLIAGSRRPAAESEFASEELLGFS